MNISTLVAKIKQIGIHSGSDHSTKFAITPDLTSDSGWTSISGKRHDHTWSEIQELYTDALTAWRKNPLAWRIIRTTANYVVGDGIHFTSQYPTMNDYIQRFELHRKNQLQLRMPSMCEELSRAGDLFVVLFRNPIDGLSFIRFVTKDNIYKIECAENDWETELVYWETAPGGTYDPKKWLSPDHPDAPMSDAVMMHYSVNRPMGALMGESDLTTIIPWLQRYSRMLEDRVRLHWAARAFLYLVTVPSNKVESKSHQYDAAPESGSIVVKDESETWETITPTLRGADASHDMKAVRNLIDAGSGFPPHWRGEGGDVNVATAEAMQAPPERFLDKRQQYFIWMLEDILYHAYVRAVEIGAESAIPSSNYNEVFTVESPDVSLRDNVLLSEAASNLSISFSTLQNTLQGKSETLHRIMTDLVLKFADEPQDDQTLDQIIKEVKANPIEVIQPFSGFGPGDNQPAGNP